MHLKRVVDELKREHKRMDQDMTKIERVINALQPLNHHKKPRIQKPRVQEPTIGELTTRKAFSTQTLRNMSRAQKRRRQLERKAA